MNTKKNISIKLFISILVIFLLYGLALSETVQTSMPVTVNLADYKKLAVEVSSDNVDNNKEVSQLQEILIDKFTESKLFEEIVKGSSADLLLKTKIVGLKKVGAGSRLLFGAFAGKSKAVTNAELIDLRENKLIGSFKTEGEVIWGGTKESLEAMADKIVAFIKETKEKAPKQTMPTQGTSGQPTATQKATEQTITGQRPQDRNKEMSSNINQLEELHKSGIISDEEYNRAKSKLMPQETGTEVAKSKLKNSFEKGFITIEQLKRANDELKSQTTSRILKSFLEGKIDEKTFGELY